MTAHSSADERLLLAHLAAGEEEPFVAMRTQLERALVVARSEGEKGVTVDLTVPDDAPRMSPPRFELGDVEFTLAGDEGRGVATLRVEDGLVAQLAFAIDDGDWRLGARIAEVAWTRFVEPASDEQEAHFERVPERDRDQVRLTLAEQGARPQDAEPDDGQEAGGALAPEDLSARPQGTIALPLLIPLARILDAAFPPDDERQAQALAESLAADPRLERPDAVAAAAALGEELIAALPELIDRSVAAEWLGVPDGDLPMQSLVRRWKAWTAREQPVPVIAAIAATLLASDRKHGLLDESARPLARELFHHVRKAGVLTWSDAHAQAQAWWREPGAEPGVWALVVRSLADYRMAELESDAPAEQMPPASPAPAARHEARSDRQDHHAREVSAFRDELRRAHTESERVRQEAGRLRIEAAQLRNSRIELRERIAELEAEAAPLRQRLDQLDRFTRGLQAQLAEQKGAAEAGHPDPIPEPPNEGWPADLLADLQVILCTGQDRGGARKAMADALRLAGADVTVHEANGKTPDRFPADAVVVCDVRFIGHAAADRVRVAAGRTGARVLEVRAGQGGIVRAVAVGCGRIA